MTSLSSKQRAHLRGLANRLEPVVRIGSGGLGPSALASIREAFNTRELMKVKVLDVAPESARDTADAIVAALEGVHVAQTIGRTVVLYRRHPDQPEIHLPGS
jgi:RNA-binding protein